MGESHSDPTAQPPAPRRVRVQAYGCSASVGEGEIAAGILRSEGMEIVSANDPTDAVLLHVCTVKGEAGALKEIDSVVAHTPDSHVVLSGCVTPELLRLARLRHPGRLFTATTSLNEVHDALEASFMGQTLEHLGKARLRTSSLARRRVNPVVGIVPVEQGCLDACSFCSTRLVKGSLASIPVASVVDEVRSLVDDGCREIWLTGQDAGCYGFDLGTDLAKLVQAILVKVPGRYRLRLGMGNPRHLLRYHEALAETMTDPRIFRFLHIPVQCGSDRILERMKRRHTVDDYFRLADFFHRAVPDLSLSTDIIVGFPGETEEDFESTLELMRRTRPVVCNRTRFVPRPGTPAASLEGALPREVKEKRSARLTLEFRGIATEENQRWLNSTDTVVVDGEGKHDTWLARNLSYRQVVLKGKHSLGEDVRIRVEQADAFSLYAATALNA